MKVKKIYCGYILNNHINSINNKIEESLKQTNGDIFKVFIMLYDYMDTQCQMTEDMTFYKTILKNAKISEDYFFSNNFIKVRPKKINDFYENTNKENLRIKNKEDLETISKMLFTITKKAIVMRFIYDSKEEARKEYLKQLEYMKHGILKK